MGHSQRQSLHTMCITLQGKVEFANTTRKHSYNSMCRQWMQAMQAMNAGNMLEITSSCKLDSRSLFLALTRRADSRFAARLCSIFHAQQMHSIDMQEAIYQEPLLHSATDTCI